jgi:hypothetical protein
MLLGVGYMYLDDLRGAHTVGHWRNATFIASGNGRLIIASRAFRTGTFSLVYAHVAVALCLCLAVLLAGWARYRGRRRVSCGFPMD